jgi:CheY-like chemotaxis protein
MQRILFLTADLVFLSRATGVAAQGNSKVQLASSPAALLAQAASSRADLVLLDLNTPGLDCRALVPGLRTLPSPPGSIVAFGPHVHEDRLAAAAEAGCDQVLTRGQFSARLDALLAPAVARDLPSGRG